MTFPAWDTRAFVFVNEKIHFAILDGLMIPLASGPFWILVLGVAGAWLWSFGAVRGRRTVAAASIAAAAAYAAEQALKHWVRRLRPIIAVHGTRLLLEFKNTHSFPSGHAAVVFAIALTGVRFYPRRWALWLLAATAVAYARVYVGEHYPLDVLAGALLGCVVAAISWRLPFEAALKALQRKVRGYFPSQKAAVAAAMALVAAMAAGLSTTAAEAWRLGQDRLLLEERAASLGASAREIVRINDRVMAQSKEMEFLQGLPNLLPQDKGYLRTQKAIWDDVLELRKRLAQRLQSRLYIVIDSKVNKLYVKRGFALLWAADCSVGRGNLLYDKRSGRRWEFATPHGEFHVLSKTKDPLWKRPDWAFVEAHEPIPPPDDPARFVHGALGAYLLSLGDGYLIHGLKDEKLLGRASSHGCVRVGAEDLHKLYDTVPVGTLVYIF